ncbi:MAG: 2-oxoacid:acceptor oxidoreductase family protein [Acidobacteriota bacterium]|nr:MAG: 2-oxoacid:acceptor oxidoreductase family protein [Acidobacteriota bacterium]
MKDELEIRLSGTGGQGLILAGIILSEAVLLEGKWAAQSQAFEPLSRGGVSRTDIVVSSRMVDYPLVTKLDFLLVLDALAAKVSEGMLTDDAAVMLDDGSFNKAPFHAFRTIELPLVETARALGNLRATNMVALGALVAVTGVCRRESLERAIGRRSPRGFDSINLEAMERGYRMGAEVSRETH